MIQTKIAPSILAADFSRMGEEVERLQQNGADVVHCDVMDGVFVPNISFGPQMIKDIRKRTTLPLDCHLMIVEPQKYIDKFIEAGANDITVHVEACGDRLKEVLRQIKQGGCQCGAVLSPDTPVSVLKNVIEECDLVLLMSVYPGFGGQKFIPSTLDKLKEARSLILSTGKDIDLEVDGGVTEENIGVIKQAGANMIVAGSTVFKSSDMRATIEALRK